MRFISPGTVVVFLPVFMSLEGRIRVTSSPSYIGWTRPTRSGQVRGSGQRRNLPPETMLVHHQGCKVPWAAHTKATSFILYLQCKIFISA
ncbi:uncharacterized protein P884DRAFT_59332 [Thermothelomyces heterothallicus CBS 202.75]|uniref:uncharacterized protein n=1 Tax=Thermothelomyces heterothallicus CBS 202.75 TaxID=1149848 RepID=UPI0037448D0C